MITKEEAKEKLEIKSYSKIDEIPFDYNRRKMSVIVEALKARQG